MSRRQRFADLLHRSGALHAVLAARARRSPSWLGVLTFHRFPSDGPELFDDGVVDTTDEDFDAQIAHLKRYFTILGSAELCELMAGATPPPNPAAITFDDGYLDCHARALPILERHGCKAVFFVATEVISERRVFWWDRAAYLVKLSQRDTLKLRYPVELEVPLVADRSRTIQELLRFVKRRQLAARFDLERFLEELAVAAGVRWTREEELAFADRLIMTWDQVRALQRAGMDIESHGKNHRTLQTLSRAELEEELLGSRLDLARELGEPPRLIAYPGGNPLAYSSPARTAMEKAGYSLGFSNHTGPMALRGELDVYDVRRHAISRDHLPPLLLTVLALPRLAHRHAWD
ncbi:MAG TPA: polysaccharide deacetylase family protein [Polyangiaceae bacterium]